MEEVEQICSRIVIMDKGTEISNGTKEELIALSKFKEKIIFDIDNVESKALDYISNLEGVGEVLFDENQLSIEVVKEEDMLLKVLKYFKDNNIEYIKVFNKTPTLNDVFLDITGKELRD